jgi:hypothetical protein
MIFLKDIVYNDEMKGYFYVISLSLLLLQFSTGYETKHASIRKALDFLARTQNDDGSWDLGEFSLPEEIPIKLSRTPTKVFVSSFCGIAFLAHGDTLSRGRYKRCLRTKISKRHLELLRKL